MTGAEIHRKQVEQAISEALLASYGSIPAWLRKDIARTAYLRVERYLATVHAPIDEVPDIWGPPGVSA